MLNGTPFVLEKYSAFSGICTKTATLVGQCSAITTGAFLSTEVYVFQLHRHYYRNVNMFVCTGGGGGRWGEGL